MKRKPVPSKNPGKKSTVGQIPSTKVPTGVKKPAPWEPAPGLVPLRGRGRKHENK